MALSVQGVQGFALGRDGLLSAMADIFALLPAAVAAANAVEGGHRPAAGVLKTLGILPESFPARAL